MSEPSRPTDSRPFEAAQLPLRAGPFRTSRQVLTAGGLEQPALAGYNTSNVKRGDTHQWRTWN